MVLCYIWDWISFICTIAFLLSLLTFLVPHVIQTFLKPQDLKKKYNAKWALVTGGSSGIGKALTEKLAAQGLNVVIVALGDKLLDETTAAMKKQYPNLEFRSVGVNLASPDFMEQVIEATKDIDVQLIFNNAGYVSIKIFADNPLAPQLANLHVNATAAVIITHHFVSLLTPKKLRGCVTFTSSPASLMPCPFSIIYGSSKAFLTEFATSLAAEIKHDGIDVLVLNPSPVATNFYNNDTAAKSDMLQMFKRTGNSPQYIADVLLSSVGFGVIREQGYFALSLKMLLKIVDYNFLSWVTAVFGHVSSEYKTLVKDRVQKSKTS